jgi:flagellar hook assembly protein FlgD
MEMRVYPNPGSGLTSIDVEVPSSGLVRASVYDLGGRRIRDLADGILPAGAFHLLWDGRNNEGHAMPAGVYLMRASTVHGSTQTRIVRIR